MIIEINGLSKKFGETEIIRDLNLNIEDEELHAIIGPNGAGKSTLFNLITGLYKPTAGSIKLRGEDITYQKPHEITRKGLSRSFQILNIFPKMTVFENIQVSLLWSMGYKYAFWKSLSKIKDVKKQANIILEQVDMYERRNSIAGELSYAEQRLLEIGITIGTGANIILLDEPMAGLSKREVSEVVKLILNLAKGKTLIMIEHDMEVVFSLAKQISVLVYGEIIAVGSPEIIKNNKDVQEAYLGSVGSLEENLRNSTH